MPRKPHPMLVCTRREHRSILIAFLRESNRLGLTLKAAAFIIDGTVQALGYWREKNGRRMLKRSARRLRIATDVMKPLTRIKDAHALRVAVRTASQK